MATAQETFKSTLMTVVGQAYEAAGYQLEDLSVQQASGQFRFKKPLDDDLNGFIEYQLLHYVDSEWAAGMPSRFRVTLTRTDQTNPRSKSDHPAYAQRDLGTLVVEDFGVGILPSGNHWWQFKNMDQLGKTLAEAGHLVIGYGIPWLGGDLEPDE
jgi:hypothetical protein